MFKGFLEIMGSVLGPPKKTDGSLTEEARQRESNYSKKIEQARKLRKDIEREREELEKKYLTKQERDWEFLLDIERANSIENAFFREFGIVERIGEIQKCLSTAVYTGDVSIDVIHTQLTNIERCIDSLKNWTPPERGERQALHIPSWFAMETAGEYLDQQISNHTNPMQLEGGISRYTNALEEVGASMNQIRESLPSEDTKTSNEAEQERKKAEQERKKAEQERKDHWEEELSIIGPYFSEPVATMDEKVQLETAQRLAEYAAERFRDRL